LIDSLTDEYISDYLDSVKGYRSIENSHSEFLVSRISRSLKEVLLHVAKELMQSDFIPVACELKIGENNSLNFPFNGGNIFVNGSIDRVDKYDGYIRIIDYKTGSKTFKLPDILFGLNMQMLIYLYAVTRADNLPDNTAAGILYQPSKRDTNDSGMAMNGLLQADEKLIFAMDKSNMGEYVPKLSLNKDGSISKKSNSFIEAEKFTEIFDYIEKLMAKTGESILSGDISVSPLDGRESPACKYCDYASICGIENREVPRVPDLKLQEVFDNMKED
jgi:ATP-dependent helicase/nuclease subunit B